MNLKDFVTILKIDPNYLAFKAGISRSALYNYLSGESIPTQKIAERLEDLTLRAVTVIEMRGKDDRHKAYKFIRPEDQKNAS